MSLNENSSREEILKYVKNSPLTFLRELSDKPWAQPYIDEAAKIALNKDPLYLLVHLSDKPWAQPYLDKVAKRAAKEMPLYLLIYFSHKPWAQPYLDDAAKEAAKKDPKYFLGKLADRFPHYINFALFALGDKNVIE